MRLTHLPKGGGWVKSPWVSEKTSRQKFFTTRYSLFTTHGAKRSFLGCPCFLGVGRSHSVITSKATFAGGSLSVWRVVLTSPPISVGGDVIAKNFLLQIIEHVRQVHLLLGVPRIALHVDKCTNQLRCVLDVEGLQIHIAVNGVQLLQQCNLLGCCIHRHS